MTKLLIIVSIYGFLTACAAFSVPKTPDELKSSAESTSLASVTNFPIQGSLGQVRIRLKEYAERCLSMQKIFERCGTFNCSKTKPMTFTPKVKSLSASKVQFTLQRDDPNSLPVGKLPKDGMYVMVAEAETTGGKIMGHVWAAKFGYGDISGTTQGWMTGENKTCPDL
jgi:hypothetical protein